MDLQVLLQIMMLFLTVNGQSTTTIQETTGTEKGTTNNLEETKGTSETEGDLQPAESTIRYMIVEPEDDNKEKPDNDITFSNDSDEDTELDLMIKALADEDKILSGNFHENHTEENGDDTGVKFVVEGNDEPLLASNTDEIETRRLSPEFEQPMIAEEKNDEITENNRNPSVATASYESSADNSPLLHLTQGGYQRPFQPSDMFNDQHQRLSSESATQQDKRVETPSSSQQTSASQIPTQGGFRPIFQPPFSFGSGSVLRHPFIQQPNVYGNQNGAVPSSLQNTFYNTQPDFSQGQFSQLSGANDFPTVHFSVQPSQRTALSNPDYLFQNSNPFQFPFSQPMQSHTPSHVSPFFGTGNPVGFSAYNPADSNGPEFSPYVAQANPSSQGSPNLNGGTPNFGRNFYANPSLMANYPVPEDLSRFSPRPLSPSFFNSQTPIQGLNDHSLVMNAPASDTNEKQTELMNGTPNKEDPVSVPFGARIGKPNDDQEPSDLERQDNVYIRYPMTEAGYATEESLPAKNESEEKSKGSEEEHVRPPLSFFTIPRQFNFFQGPDPYRIALENVQRQYPNIKEETTEIKNGTEENKPEQFVPEIPLIGNQIRPDVPAQIFRPYPERSPNLAIPNAPYYSLPGVGAERNPFESIALFPDNRYQFPSRTLEQNEHSATPACAEKTNTSLCFEDSEYPKRELLYALNSDSFLTERLVMPDQQLDGIPLVDLNVTETPDSEDNYICKSEIKYGLPLRAKDVKGNWKVIVNMEKAVGRGNFIQPVRLEICRGAGNPCSSVTEIKTSCVQKYSLQRLLSWSLERGVHNDVFRLPVACSCQILP